MKYLIKHTSLYWRANSRGYTNDIGEAGIYGEKEATGIRRLNRIPIDMLIPLDINIKEDIMEELDRCKRMVDRLNEMLIAVIDEVNK